MYTNINFEKSSSQIFPLENESGRPGSNTFQNCDFRFLVVFLFCPGRGEDSKLLLKQNRLGRFKNK
jgi:hypothetical protein